MAFARLFPLLAFLLLSFAFTATALKCKFLTVDLTPAGGDQSDKKSDEKEYECPKQVSRVGIGVMEWIWRFWNDEFE
jgi:hypothetical protein